jgi:hypothetical protein
MNDSFFQILSIVLTLIIAILGWKMHRKTEEIKIMKEQLSDKKYKSYRDIISIFFDTIKSTKSGKKIICNLTMDQFIDIKKDIFMYGSDSVFFAFNSCLTGLSEDIGNQKKYVDSILGLMLTIRQDMCGKKSKVSKEDILINLMQNKAEVKKFLSSLE